MFYFQFDFLRKKSESYLSKICKLRYFWRENSNSHDFFSKSHLEQFSRQKSRILPKQKLDFLSTILDTLCTVILCFAVLLITCFSGTRTDKVVLSTMLRIT